VQGEEATTAATGGCPKGFRRLRNRRETGRERAHCRGEAAMVAMSRMPKGSNGLQPVDVGQGRGVMGWWAGPHVVVVA
jgi:hypothetical protein